MPLTDDEQKILQDFAEKLLENQEDLPPEFQKVIDDHFWEGEKQAS